MLISALIILACFILIVIFILTDKMNRAVVSLAGAIVTYFVLIFLEGLSFDVIVDLLFGNAEDGYVNLHSLILIIGMMIIVEISHQAGVFQFLAINLIKLSKGKPIRLMVIFCVITIILSAVLNNILTVIILIPLTITVSRIINIDPTPYILTQAVLVNIGGTFFTISSIPNILISIYADISFTDFFLNVGVISLVIFGFTLIFFIFLYKDKLVFPKEGMSVLKEFEVWNVVQNKRLLYECIFGLVLLFILFIIVPSTIITADILALSVAIILIVISKLEPKDIISKIDLELILYLLGIFVIAGGLEITGFVDILGGFLLNIAGDQIYFQIILILWASAFLSSSIDNIPITKVLIPVIGSMEEGSQISRSNNSLFYSLAIGANWGDNLTPLGDNILVVNLAEKNNRSITFKQFFKIGFFTTIYQLIIVSLIFTFIYFFLLGLILSLLMVGFISFLFLLSRFGPNRIQSKITIVQNRIKNFLTR